MDKTEFIKQFCGKDSLRPILMQPLRAGEWMCATDAHFLIGYKGGEGPSSPGPVATCAELLNGKGPTVGATLDLAELERVMSIWPMEDETEDEECAECHGEGEVECECCECGNEHMAFCKKCEGEGVVNSRPTGRKIPASGQVAHIEGIGCYGWVTLNPLRQALRHAGVINAKVTHGSEKNAMRVEVAEYVAVCMPVVRNTSEEPVGIIKLNR